MKTVLIYVLGCTAHPYPMIIEKSINTWDSCHVDGVETLFYFGRGRVPSNPKMIQLPVDDSLWMMGHKDLAGFEWALKNRQWDFMARVNVPTYVNKRRLWEHVQNLPDQGLIRGVCAPYNGGKYLWGGMHFILSRDVVSALVKHGREWDHRHIEDVSLSMLAQKIGFQLDCRGRGCAVCQHPDKWTCIWYDNGTQGGFEFHHFSEMNKANGQFFYRTKQDYVRRHIDLEIMQELYINHL